MFLETESCHNRITHAHIRIRWLVLCKTEYTQAIHSYAHKHMHARQPKHSAFLSLARTHCFSFNLAHGLTHVPITFTTNVVRMARCTCVCASVCVFVCIRGRLCSGGQNTSEPTENLISVQFVEKCSCSNKNQFSFYKSTNAKTIISK